MNVDKEKKLQKMVKYAIEATIFVFLYVIIYVFLSKNKYQIFFQIVPQGLLSLLILVNIFVITHILFDKKNPWYHLLLFTYFLLLISVLFIRPPYKSHQYIDENYLKTWWKYLFKNRVVFINVVGNVLLFIPLGIILKINFKSLVKYFLSLLIIIVLELIQLLTKRGIFDFNDIILNYGGSLLGMMLIGSKGDLDEAKK